jgi:hypothetical protein
METIKIGMKTLIVIASFEHLHIKIWGNALGSVSAGAWNAPGTASRLSLTGLSEVVE